MGVPFSLRVRLCRLNYEPPLLSSSQNIDRIVSAYLACKNAGKLLVIDIYTAWVLEQLLQVSQSTPNMDWPAMRVFATHSQDEKLKASGREIGPARLGLQQDHNCRL